MMATSRNNLTIARNPLGYYCAPNAATPDYVASSDIEDFVAYGMLMSYQDPDYITEELAVTDEDIRWLRKNFLDTVVLTLDALHGRGRYRSLERGSNYQGDQVEGTVYLQPPGWDRTSSEEPPLELALEWRLDMLSDDNQVCLALCWRPSDSSSTDDTAIWCRAGCFNNRLRVLECVADARVVNGLLVTPLDRQLAARWQERGAR